MTATVQRATPAATGRAHRAARPTALVIGPVPPPWHGGAVATRTILDSTVAERFRLVHVDTSDRRGMENIGRLDVGNVALALAHFGRYLRALHRERPDLVYVPLAQNRLGLLRDALFLLPARALGRRVVVHVHGGGFRAFYDDTDPLTRAIVRASLRGAAAIVLGERLRGMMAGLVPPERVAVVPNGIADPYAEDPARAASATCRVAYLGTLMEAKGFLDVLAAAAQLAPERPDVRVTLAGAFFRPSDRERAAPYIEALGERVTLAGVVAGEAKAALLRAADIFAFPTHYPYEGHPYVILEAMAAGLPVVTTARAAIPETVVDGETGLIVPERDPAALAAAIRRLADDPSLRARLGRAARRRFRERYTLDTWAAGMTATFEQALAAP